MEFNQDSQFEEFVSGKMGEEALYFLESAGKWAKFLAILGFIGMAFLALAGLGVMAMGSALDGAASTVMPIPMGALGIVYLVLAGVYILPVLYLYRFASNATQAARGGRPEALTEAMRYLRAHYRFIGIMTIAVMGLYILGIVAAVIFGAANAF